MPKYKIGDKVMKPTGYAFDGIIVAVCDLPDIGLRYIVKQEDMFSMDEGRKNRRIAGGALHIFSESQLELQ